LAGEGVTDNVTPFPPREAGPDEFLFKYHELDRVLIDNHEIPHLRGSRSPDGRKVMLCLDNRFLLELPADIAKEVAAFAANALAIGQGYPWYGAKSKEQPFAPTAAGLGSVPTA
jgi:hypothetical protein